MLHEVGDGVHTTLWYRTGYMLHSGILEIRTWYMGVGERDI